MTVRGRSLALLLVAAAFVALPATSWLLAAPEPQEGVPGVVRTQIEEDLGVSELQVVWLDLPAEPLDSFGFWIRLGDADHHVNLERHSLRSPEFRLLTTEEDGSLVEVEAPPVRTYRGSIDGLPDSHVRANLDHNGALNAVLVLDTETEWNVQPIPSQYGGLRTGNVHAAYRTGNVLPTDHVCGVEDIPEDDFHKKGIDGAFGEKPIGNWICEIACDADREFYQQNGSNVGQTMNDIEAVLNACDSIYDRDVDVVYEITTILVRTSEPDPYSSTNPSTLLGQFATQWQNNHQDIQRDIAHLFTGKNIDGGVIGIASLAVICVPGYGLSESRFTSNFSARVGLTAHELGHNWASPHCSGNDCRIMCPGLGGCSGDLSRFGEFAKTSIINHRNSRTCLELDPLVPPVAPPFMDTFANSTIDPLLWLGVEGAISDTGADNEPSPPRSMRLTVSSEARSNISLFGSQADREPFVSYWVEEKNTEPGDFLRVEYLDRFGDWQPLNTIISNSATTSNFSVYFHALNSNASHDLLRLKFRSEVDQSGDFFFVDDVRISEPSASVQLTPRVSAVRAGNTLPFDASVTSLLTTSQNGTAWIDIYRPDGSPLTTNPRIGPKAFNLNAGETKTKTNIRIRIPASTPPGLGYRLVTYVGTFPDQIDYADDLFFQVTEPQ